MENYKKANGERYYVTVESFKIAFRKWGDTGKPIMLLHGIPMNSSLWNLAGNELSSNGYCVYAPEMLGLGYTDGAVNCDHSLKQQAKIIELFIRKVVGEECIIVGHDLGGGVAQIIATEHQSIINKCVLTNCVAFDSWPVEGMKKLVACAKSEEAFNVFNGEFLNNFLKNGLSLGVKNKSVINNELIEDIYNGLGGSKDKIEHFIRFLGDMDNKYTQEAAKKLLSFNKPTLVVWAKDDIFQPISVGEKLCEAIPDSKWKVIEGGHFHSLENTALAKTIIEWDK
jgi:pimeloyl-ACP methyl ester carboxylesterase